MPFNPFSVLTSKIFAGASAVLLVGVVICWLGWSHAAHQRDGALKANGALETKLSASNASIDLLQSKIAEQNADTERRAAEYASAQKQAENDSRANAERAKGSDALIQRLKERASQKGSGCTVPADLRREAEGL